jgi:L-lactate dehydrogenase complex protein LldF
VGILRAPTRAISAGDARGRFSKLPFAGGWTDGRDLPAPEGDTFFARYAREQRAGRIR